MRPTVASIIKATAVEFKQPIDRLVAPDGIGSRAAELSRPRLVAMYLAREMSSTPRRSPELGRQPVSYPTIGRIFNRDHTTVLYAFRRVPTLVKDDSELAEKIKRIRESVEVMA